MVARPLGEIRRKELSLQLSLTNQICSACPVLGDDDDDYDDDNYNDNHDDFYDNYGSIACNCHLQTKYARHVWRMIMMMMMMNYDDNNEVL